MQNLKKQLCEKYIERKDVIDGILTSIIAEEHVLVLGPAGTAKSDLARDIFGAIKGSDFFYWLLSKFTVPEEIFGPISFKSLKEDEYKRILTGKLPEADGVFLDEIFKANSSILNSLLTALNEKKFFNHTDVHDIPLITCVGASNELPEGEGLEALFDRFLMRYWIKYITDGDKFKKLLKDGNNITIDQVTIEDIRKLQRQVKNVEFPDELFDLIIEVKFKLKDNGIIASDRRWVKVVKIFKAHAILEERDKVIKADFNLLRDMLWNDPKQKNQIIEVLGELVNPEAIKAIKIMDAAKETYNNLPKPSDGQPKSSIAIEWAKVIPIFDEQIEKIAELKKANPDCPEVIEAEQIVGEYRVKLGSESAKMLNLG